MSTNQIASFQLTKTFTKTVEKFLPWLFKNYKIKYISDENLVSMTDVDVSKFSEPKRKKLEAFVNFIKSDFKIFTLNDIEENDQNKILENYQSSEKKTKKQKKSDNDVEKICNEHEKIINYLTLLIEKADYKNLTFVFKDNTITISGITDLENETKVTGDNQKEEKVVKEKKQKSNKKETKVIIQDIQKNIELESTLSDTETVIPNQVPTEINLDDIEF